MDKLQQLIDAIEFEMEIVEMDYKNHVQVSGAITHKMLDFLLVKAKELQAEQDGHKWAVVKESEVMSMEQFEVPEQKWVIVNNLQIFNTKERAEQVFDSIGKYKDHFTIVKIIEP
jgi:hypothetical protein